MELQTDKKKVTKLKHVRVYDQLYRLIKEGVYPPGSQLPSEPALAEQLSVSRMTLRRALALLKEDHLVQNVRGKGNYICAPSRHTGTVGALGMRHPIYSCCARESEAVELEFRIEPPTEAITQTLGQKPAAVVIADRYYRQGEGAVAYSLSFIPIEVIGEKQVDLSRPGELEAFLETALYEGEYGSTCAFSYTTTGNFTAVRYTLSPESAFILIQETVYDGSRRIVVSSKHYIPVERFEMHLAAGLGEKGKEAL